MAHIIAYHPEIVVRKKEELFVIKMNLDDWAPDEEVLGILASETGAKTMGELVESIESNRNSCARIEKVKKVRDGRRVYDWGDAMPTDTGEG